MTLDGFTLYFIVREAAHQIIGCKVDKVHQPQPDTILLSLRSFGSAAKNMRLLISAGAMDSRLHMTNQKYTNPKTPPMFCMFLRKYITNSKISKIEQIGLERIVSLTFESNDELGIPHELTLVAELMGKYSNIILINENNIIMDSLRHVTNAQSRVRRVLPSLEYEPPRSSKLNPLTASKTTLAEMLDRRGECVIKDYLTHILEGVSGQTADEILFRYMPGGYELKQNEPEKLAENILSFFKDSKPEPTMYFRKDGLPVFFSPVKFESILADRTEKSGSVNELVDEFYKRQSEIRLFNSKRESLHKRAAKQIEKLSSLLQKQLDSIEKAKKAESFKETGDIITANIYRIIKGSDTLTAQDYTTGEPMTIKLNPRFSAAVNAQMNYKKYSKLKSGMQITVSRMLENKKEIAFLESVQVSLDSSETLDELFEIEYELSKAGLLPAHRASAKAAEQPSVPHKFISSDGYTFFAGKNNRQNDTLTMKTALPDDVWLHTKDIPGSHVVITGAVQNVPENTLFEAATIAATLSKAKGSAKIAIDYTRRKNVRKPNGAKPGMVIYEHYNTILVSPDREMFEKLLVK